jgi:hypothetical protein
MECEENDMQAWEQEAILEREKMLRDALFECVSQGVSDESIKILMFESGLSDDGFFKNRLKIEKGKKNDY